MSETILLVDDDESILSSYSRTLHRQFSVETAAGPHEALERIAGGGLYPVVVSDMRMPLMNGLDLLRRVHDLSPDSILLMLTGNADLRTAIDAVNEGDIFRFLEKPCPNEVLSKALSSACEQYRLKLVQKELLQKTLHGSIKVLTDVLGLVNPEAFSTASRITLYVKHVVAQLGVTEGWRFEMAAMLSQLGCVVLPTETLEAVRLGRKLSPDQEIRFASHPTVARNLLQHIPRLESIAAMVGRQREPCREHSNIPIAQRGEETLGAQILKVCIRFEALVRSGESHVEAINVLLTEPDQYDPLLVAPLSQLPSESTAWEPRTIEITDLACRMVLDEDLRAKAGTLLVAKGIEVTETLLARIHNFYSRGSVPNSIRVLTPVPLGRWLGKDLPNPYLSA